MDHSYLNRIGFLLCCRVRAPPCQLLNCHANQNVTCLVHVSGLTQLQLNPQATLSEVSPKSSDPACDLNRQVVLLKWAGTVEVRLRLVFSAEGWPWHGREWQKHHHVNRRAQHPSQVRTGTLGQGGIQKWPLPVRRVEVPISYCCLGFIVGSQSLIWAIHCLSFWHVNAPLHATAAQRVGSRVTQWLKEYQHFAQVTSITSPDWGIKTPWLRSLLSFPYQQWQLLCPHHTKPF